MALHEQSIGATNEWYTPSYAFDALGCRFDLDAASPGQAITPWIPADEFITTRSLETAWRGFAWLNAPFGGRNALAPWRERYVPRAELVLFVAKKIRFIGVDGQEGKSPAQGTCLYSFGPRGRAALENAVRCGLGVLMIPASTVKSDRSALKLEEACSARSYPMLAAPMRSRGGRTSTKNRWPRILVKAVGATMAKM